jgi:hypothetical protein
MAHYSRHRVRVHACSSELSRDAVTEIVKARPWVKTSLRRQPLERLGEEVRIDGPPVAAIAHNVVVLPCASKREASFQLLGAMTAHTLDDRGQ